jgi:aconitate hydratase
MGIIPLEFVAGEDADKLGLTGKETFSIDITGAAPRSTVTVKVNGGAISEFKATLRIDTETEVNYFKVCPSPSLSLYVVVLLSVAVRYLC